MSETTSKPKNSDTTSEIATPPLKKPRSHRVVIGFTLIGVTATLAAFGSWWWASFVMFFLWVGFHEMCGIMAAREIRPSKVIVLTVGTLMIAVAAMGKSSWLPPLLTAGMIACFFRLLFRQPRASITDIGATLLALVYVAFLPVHYILLRELGAEGIANPLAQPGLKYLIFILFVVSASDVGAYYIGKLFGKSLLYPELSPKKTREGAFGGVLGGVAMALLLSGWVEVGIAHAVILSILIVIVAQLGDLTESMIKRDAGVKDSGVFLQGHGGILDRGDSYVFTGTIAYYYIYWVVLKQGLAEEVLRLLGY